MNKHWSNYFLKEQILSISPLGNGTPHHLDLVELVDHSKWVCKRFQPQNWLGKVDGVNLEQTEKLAGEVANHLSVSFAAYQLDNQIVFSVEDTKAIIIPYCEGRVLAFFSEEQAFKLGNLLAKLHSLKLAKEDLQPFPSVILPKENNAPTWLTKLIDSCNNHLHYRSDQWVVSHRDIHAENIVWRAKNKPHLLDWESAGLIHPAIELIGVAENCAGCAYGDFNAANFRATIMGYCQQTGMLPQINSRLWTTSFHTWLLWYSYCLRQKQLEEANHTLELIKHIDRNMFRMQKIYYDCYLFISNSYRK